MDSIFYDLFPLPFPTAFSHCLFPLLCPTTLVVDILFAFHSLHCLRQSFIISNLIRSLLHTIYFIPPIMKTSTIAILAALGGLQTAVAQIISGTPVWVDATTCDPWAKSNGFPAAAGPGGLFTTAVGILGQIVDANLYRMNHPSKQSQTTLPANVLAWERYRLNSTYGAFFGNNTDTTPVALGVWEVVCKLESWLRKW